MSHPNINTAVNTQNNTYEQFEKGVFAYFGLVEPQETPWAKEVGHAMNNGKKGKIQTVSIDYSVIGPIDIGFEFAEDNEEAITQQKDPNKQQVQQGLKEYFIPLIASLDEHLIDKDDMQAFGINKELTAIIRHQITH